MSKQIKKAVSQKAREAWKKNLSQWEDKQRAVWFVLGASLVILIWLLSINK